MGKRTAIAVFVVTVLILAGLILAGIFVRRALPAPTLPAGSASTTPSSAISAASAQSQKAVLTKVTGTAERRDSSGVWLPLKLNDEVGLKDVIRTGMDSSAEIALGETVTVVAADRTSFTVAEVSESISRVELDDGRISTNVRGRDGYRFRVQVRGSDAVAEAESGEFAMLRRGSGPVAVVAKSGRVKLSAAEESVEVGPGEQSVIEPGKAPAAPTEIPASLFLKIGNPVADADGSTEIDGRTVPGAVVSVGGVSMPVGGDGSFEGTVPLRADLKEIVVVVQDVTGREVRKSVSLIRKPKPPRVVGSVQW